MPNAHQLRLAASGPVNAVVRIPGSKSITNRAYILAALANGTTTLHGALISDDTRAMTGCLSLLGIEVDVRSSETMRILGRSGDFSAPSGPLFVGNSGTTIRFLTAAAPLAPTGSFVTLDGIPRMRQRPIGDLVDALRQLGVTASTAQNGCPPVVIAGGGLTGSHCSVKGTMSSQYLSAILMASPYAASGVEITVEGELVSKPYIDITLSMMADFGIRVHNNDYRSFDVPKGCYTGRPYQIEPDASNASYFAAGAAVSGSNIEIDGLGTSSIQGDTAFLDVLEEMGCEIHRSQNHFQIIGPPTLKAVEFDASAIPDMAQTIAVVACFAQGTTHLTGLKTLRVKETDRITAMATELRKIGANVVEGPDSLVITPAADYRPAAIDTYDDHRMAMSFAIAGLRVNGLQINDPDCVAKTFPDFWSRWSAAFPNAIVEGTYL